MQFNLPRPVFAHALAAVGRVISDHAHQPVLTGVRLEAGEGKLRLLGSDNYETWMCLSVPVTAMSAGSVVVPARHLTALVSRIPAEHLTAATDPGKRSLNLSWSTGRLGVQGFDPADFPCVPDVAPTCSFEVDRGSFRRLVRQTLFVLPSKAHHGVLTGALLTREDGYLAMVATDGHRLAVARIPVPDGLADGCQAVIPGKALGLVARLLDGDGPPVKVDLGQSLACFQSDGLTVVTRLLGGQFPSYRRVIPGDALTTLKVERKAFENVCALALAILRDSGRAMQLDLADAQKGTVRVRADVVERGSSEEELAAAQVDGAPLKIAFNPRYLLEALGRVRSS